MKINKNTKLYKDPRIYGFQRSYVEEFLKSKVVDGLDPNILPIMLFYVLADSDEKPYDLGVYSIMSSAVECNGKRTHYSEDTMKKFDEMFFDKGLKIYNIK